MYIDIASNISYFLTKKKVTIDNIILECKKRKILPIFVGTGKNNQKVFELARKYKTGCYLGVHPTESSEFIDDFKNDGKKYTNLYENFNYNNIIENENFENDIKDNKNIILEKNLENKIIDMNNYFENVFHLYDSQKNILGIGECGLDNCRLNFSSFEDQKKIFKMHISSKDLNRKYFFHCRESFKEFYKIIKKEKGIIHSFTGNNEDLNLILKNDQFISLNGLCLQNDFEILRRIPLNKLLIETDSPFCKPKRNFLDFEFSFFNKIYTSVDVPVIYRFLSDLFKVPEERFKEQIESNFLDFFGDRGREILNEWKKDCL